MHINLEASNQNAVQSYSNSKIQINSLIYECSLIVSREEIITDLTIKSIKEVNEQYLDLLLKSKPEVIIIGHNDAGAFPPLELMSTLSKLRIGLECMSIGAACRTYNVLLGEHRSVVAGIII